jgi:hypothetical protein
LLAQDVTIDTDLRIHPDVLWYPDLASWATVKDDMAWEPGLYGEAPTTWPKMTHPTEHGFGGIASMRFESCSRSPDTVTGSNAHLGLGIMVFYKWLYENTRGNLRGSWVNDAAEGPITEMYFRYSIMAESSVWQGFDETGMKLPGLQNGGDGAWMSVMHHSAPGHVQYSPPYNSATQKIEWETYFGGLSDVQPNPYYAGNWMPSGIFMQPDTWHTVEQHVRMNTVQHDGTANPDGIAQVWVDDVLQVDLQNIRLQNFPPGTTREINRVYGLIYHGGNKQSPLTPIHYRVTGLCAAKRRIGAPKRV